MFEKPCRWSFFSIIMHNFFSFISESFTFLAVILDMFCDNTDLNDWLKTKHDSEGGGSVWGVLRQSVRGDSKPEPQKVKWKITLFFMRSWD